MKSIILSAGQGKRLFPHTIDCPKCLLPVADGCTLLSWQLRQLAREKVGEAVVVTGFEAARVEQEIQRHRDLLNVRSLLNPDYARSDNLASAALARPEMTDDFIILNGDTLITPAIVAGLCAAPRAPVTVTVARKHDFDADDMKAIVREGRLTAVAKTLDAREANAESIGMIRFQGEGVGWFREALAAGMQAGDAARKYYLSAIDRLARERTVAVYEVAQTDWAEVDVPDDLRRARALVERWSAALVE